MSSYDDDTSDDGGNPNAALRVARKENDELRKMVENLARSQAARDAGLDMKNPQHRYFIETFDGKPDEMESKAQELGFISSQASAQQQAADQATDALGRISGAATSQGGAAQSMSNAGNQQLRDEANALLAEAKTGRGDRQKALDWARKAGVPFIG